MVHYRRNRVIVVIANGIYGYEQYLLDPRFFATPATPPKAYVALNHWDFVKLAQSMGVPFAQPADTTAAFDAALAAARDVADGPSLIVAQVGPPRPSRGAGALTTAGAAWTEARSGQAAPPYDTAVTRVSSELEVNNKSCRKISRIVLLIVGSSDPSLSVLRCQVIAGNLLLDHLV